MMPPAYFDSRRHLTPVDPYPKGPAGSPTTSLRLRQRPNQPPPRFGGRSMHVFVYGPLLNPASLRAALPEVDLGACRPARLAGHVRCFDLESPNDGSHPDASYTHPGGAPPSHLLLCNLRPSRDYAVNGV